MFGIFVAGFIIALLGLELFFRNRNLGVTWYDRLIGAIGLLLIGFAIWHLLGSMVEMYPKAGWMGLLIFSIPGLILLAVSWQLIARRQRAAG